LQSIIISGSIIIRLAFLFYPALAWHHSMGYRADVIVCVGECELVVFDHTSRADAPAHVAAVFVCVGWLMCLYVWDDWDN
jgi:hypothetical protein